MPQVPTDVSDLDSIASEVSEYDMFAINSKNAKTPKTAPSSSETSTQSQKVAPTPKFPSFDLFEGPARKNSIQYIPSSDSPRDIRPAYNKPASPKKSSRDSTRSPSPCYDIVELTSKKPKKKKKATTMGDFVPDGPLKKQKPPKKKNATKVNRARDSSPPAEPIEIEGEYVVEEIMAQSGEGPAALYLVKWKGYPASQNTWEPESSFLVGGVCEALSLWKTITAGETHAPKQLIPSKPIINPVQELTDSESGNHGLDFEDYGC